MSRASLGDPTNPRPDLEDVSEYVLDEASRERLFALQNECIVCWSTQDGWPMGMPHNFVWAGRRFWVTTTSQRKRVTALRRHPESCVVVSGKGTEMGANRMVAAKTRAVVHDDRATLEWFLPLFLRRRVTPPQDDDDFARQHALFDTLRRVVVEFDPVRFLSFDGAALHRALADDV